MKRWLAFLGKFLVLAAGLFWLWAFTPAGHLYTRLVAALGAPAVRLTSGFEVEGVASASGEPKILLRGMGRRMEAPFRPREQFSGLIPFLALLGATGGLGWRRRLRALLVGLPVLVAVHVGFVVLGPFMTGYPQAQLGVVWMRRINRVIDVGYTFYALVGYAALPFLLWFALAGRSFASGR